MKRVLIILSIMILLTGCATLKQKGPFKTETLTTLHFITFKTNPPGAGVLVIDLLNGRESAMLGTTPVKILILKKEVEIYSNGQKRLVNITPTFPGPITTGKNIAEGAEFQFKFRLQGYYDEMVVERVNLLTTESSDKMISVNLTKVGHEVKN